MSYFAGDRFNYVGLPNISSKIFPLNVSSDTFLQSYKGQYPEFSNTDYYPREVKIITNSKDKFKIDGKMKTYDKLMKSAITSDKDWVSVGTVIPENQSLNNDEVSDTLSLELRPLPGIDHQYQFRLVQYGVDKNGKKGRMLYALPIGNNYLKDRLLFGPILGLENLGTLQVWLKSIYKF
jgi:hypothetical protein